MTASPEDWVGRLADEVIAAAEPGVRIVCASGLSPSGPIHLGNLREVLTPHLVADEIRRRGRDCEHLLSWDDFDRFRRVPAGIDPAWEAHVGKPLTAVPAPPGSEYPHWAAHFAAPMRAALQQLGVRVREISQTEQYTAGAYRDQVLLAMRRRADIDAVLARYRTKEGNGPTGEYFPYRPYCGVCDRDLTTVTTYDDATTALTYRCACGHVETVPLSEHTRGKLVWKVDWPMRWAYEGVDFEPSGVDHSSPGSSFAVGGQLVGPIFGGRQPIGPMYAFVGITGMAKMSSSRGGVPTPGEALDIMEPALLRWLYARRKPNQSFTIAFNEEIQRLYDEWDALTRRVTGRSAQPADRAAYLRAIGTADGELATTPRPLPYRTLVSIVDITTGDEEQTLRILADLDVDDPISALDQIRPRLDCAANWAATQMPEELRTRVLEAPDAELLAALDDRDRAAIGLLVAGLDRNWSLAGLTTLVYGVPKQILGLAPDVHPTPELKAAQRAFFVLLYRLLIGRDTGPRLPTLLLATGADRAHKLLGA